ncbi:MULTISPECIES: hypothetical protein [Candidatus Nitrosocaldus]|nr:MULTISPECIES: hypothetical protein [Candidatus Nitrosocaldus]
MMDEVKREISYWVWVSALITGVFALVLTPPLCTIDELLLTYMMSISLTVL